LLLSLRSARADTTNDASQRSTSSANAGVRRSTAPPRNATTVPILEAPPSPPQPPRPPIEAPTQPPPPPPKQQRPPFARGAAIPCAGATRKTHAVIIPRRRGRGRGRVNDVVAQLHVRDRVQAALGQRRWGRADRRQPALLLRRRRRAGLGRWDSYERARTKPSCVSRDWWANGDWANVHLRRAGVGRMSWCRRAAQATGGESTNAGRRNEQRLHCSDDSIRRGSARTKRQRRTDRRVPRRGRREEQRIRAAPPVLLIVAAIAAPAAAATRRWGRGRHWAVVVIRHDDNARSIRFLLQPRDANAPRRPGTEARGDPTSFLETDG
jgi:hypothetical protein